MGRNARRELFKPWTSLPITHCEEIPNRESTGEKFEPDLSLPPSSSLFDAIFSHPTPKAREKRPGDEVGEG